jgi:hypothetical protein
VYACYAGHHTRRCPLAVCGWQRAQNLLRPDYVLKHGDAVLFEAYESLLRKHKHSSHFSLLREVPDSTPPTTNGLMDKYVLALAHSSHGRAPLSHDITRQWRRTRTAYPC